MEARNAFSATSRILRVVEVGLRRDIFGLTALRSVKNSHLSWTVEHTTTELREGITRIVEYILE